MITLINNNNLLNYEGCEDEESLPTSAIGLLFHLKPEIRTKKMDPHHEYHTVIQLNFHRS